MKTLRDTNNNNSNTTSNTIQPHFPSGVSPTTYRQNLIPPKTSTHSNSTSMDLEPTSYPSLLSSARLQQPTSWQQPSLNYHNQSGTSPTKIATHHNNHINPSLSQLPTGLFASMFNGDANQWTTAVQAYLSKCGGNQCNSSDAINPWFYLQLMNANSMFIQQLAALQNSTLSTPYDPTKHRPSSIPLSTQQTPISGSDMSTEVIHSERTSQVLQPDSNIFVPRTRPMTQDEIVEHARLVYQRALQRNQLQQHNDLMKHFYETMKTKQEDIPTASNDNLQSVNRNDVPSVPNVSNIASIGTFDVLDTMVRSPSSCLSVKEGSVDAVLSSLSLLSVDDAKMTSNAGSALDPGAPVFIPRQNRGKLDDDNETSSSSSDSDFNDFHYLDQFLEEFYHSNNNTDNHLIIRKSSSSNIANDVSNQCTKHTTHQHILGQGDATEQLTCETVEHRVEQSVSISPAEQHDCQYSIYELLNRYRNPRCHLVLPEWSRLSLILPNVCSMRSHTYKIKRYFAYRRRLDEDQVIPKDLNNTLATNISIHG